MIRLSAVLLAAVMALAPLEGAAAQSRDSSRGRDDRSEQERRPERPRVSPDEARRNAEAASDGRRVGMRVRPDGDYGVVIERRGQVREVVVDSQTGQVRGQQRPR